MSAPVRRLEAKCFLGIQKDQQNSLALTSRFSCPCATAPGSMGTMLRRRWKTCQRMAASATSTVFMATLTQARRSVFHPVGALRDHLAHDSL